MERMDGRPDPDALLDALGHKADTTGKLCIYFGYAAGVGKTYAMLDDAQEQYKCGVRVLVGYVEPHTRPETMHLMDGLPALPPKMIAYRGIQLKEFDLDEALKRKPSVILVDELAHTNAPGTRNRKRYQDVEELLNAGIDVYTTVNVQHIESLNDVVYDMTGVRVQETVPDYLFDRADKIKLIDIEPEALLIRLSEGKVYRSEQAATAMQNFFVRDNLKLLREVTLRKTADKISNENQNERHLAAKMASPKLLVCFGSSPSSAKCIRWTARSAEAFHAHWIAVYIEHVQSENLTLDQQKNIRANMGLAERLGAEVVTLQGNDIALTVAEYAKLCGITNIVIGKSRDKPSFKTFFESDLEDKLIALLPNIEVHIIPDNAGHRFFRPPQKPVARRPLNLSWHDTAKMAALLAISTLLSLLLHLAGLDGQTLMLPYILSVLIISRITNGYVYGVAASVIATLMVDFLFTAPKYSFKINDPEYPIAMVAMLLTALITSAMTVRVKTQMKLAVAREHRTEVLHEINKKLLITRGTEQICELINAYIVQLFGRSTIFYTEDPDSGKDGSFAQATDDVDLSMMAAENERAVAHWTFINQKRAGAGTDTLMGAKAFYLPVISQGHALAALGISCNKGTLTHDERMFLGMIASQVAMALERQRLSDEQQKIMITSENEKMRSNLLRAISHDLRTPLTGILGACSAVRDSAEKLDSETEDKMLASIQDEAQWLIRMVENLLSVTRISEGAASIHKTMEAVEEVIGAAVCRVKKRFSSRQIRVTVPEKFIEVPMDATLIEQVIINLLENAIRFSPEETVVEIRLREEGMSAVLEVLDNGHGVADEDLPNLFDPLLHGKSKTADSSRGMGIGLSLCMSIIQAHGGKLEAENRREGGAVFRFTLPMERRDEERCQQRL
ncbi:MAG: sensor histidine kinase KdpD [Clostridia bacterium]